MEICTNYSMCVVCPDEVTRIEVSPSPFTSSYARSHHVKELLVAECSIIHKDRGHIRDKQIPNN